MFLFKLGDFCQRQLALFVKCTELALKLYCLRQGNRQCDYNAPPCHLWMKSLLAFGHHWLTDRAADFLTSFMALALVILLTVRHS